MRVAEGIDGDAGAEIEIALAVLGNQPAAFSAHEDDVLTGVGAHHGGRMPRPSRKGRGVFSPAPRGKKTCAWITLSRKSKSRPLPAARSQLLIRVGDRRCQRRPAPKCRPIAVPKAMATAQRLKAAAEALKSRHIPCRESSVAASPLLPVNTPELAAPPCRRDSACCNFSRSGHEIWRRVAPAARLCIGPDRALGQSLVSVARVLSGAFVPRLSQVSAFVTGRDRRPSPPRRLRLRARWGSIAAVFLRAPGGVPPLMRLEREHTTECLGLMSAWSF